MPKYEIFIDDKPKKIELVRIGGKSFNVRIGDEELTVDFPAGRSKIENGFSIKISDKTYKVRLPKKFRGNRFSVEVEEIEFQAEVKIPARRKSLGVSQRTPTRLVSRGKPSKRTLEGAVNAPMTGRILSVFVKEGDAVKAGKVLCLLEAMKMENEITTPKNGTVQEVYVSEGSPVNEGEALFLIN